MIAAFADPVRKMRLKPAEPSILPDSASGLAICFLVALFATLASLALGLLPAPLGRIPVSPIVLSIAAGLALAGIAARSSTWQPGLKFAAGPLLRLAVVLIGLRLSVAELTTLGALALPLAAIVIALGLSVVLALNRIAGTGPRLAALLAVGTAICGTSAIAAAAPGLRARPEETAYAVACVALFGMAATVVYPPLFEFLLPDARAVGMALGAAIHDTAQVSGAAVFHEQTFAADATLAAASVTKLLRNLSMLIVIPLIVVWFARQDASGPQRPAFPWFVLGFVALSIIRTLGDRLLAEDPAAWHWLLAGAGHASAFLFAMAMAALGMSMRPAALRGLGWRPAAAALTGALTMGICAVLWLI